MDKTNRETVEHYFSLVDAAQGKAAFDELMSLYSDDTESHSNDGSVSHGKAELIENTKKFYDWLRGGESRHFYHITRDEGDTVEADWAVSARLTDGTVMALQGHNVYTFNADHKIVKLVVSNK